MRVLLCCATAVLALAGATANAREVLTPDFAMSPTPSNPANAAERITPQQACIERGARSTSRAARHYCEPKSATSESPQATKADR